MKKFLACLLACLMAASMAACGSSGKGPDSSSSEAASAVSQGESKEAESKETESKAEESSAPESSQADEEGVTVTLPAFLMENIPDFDPDAYAREKGFIKAEVNDDGSLTVTMTKAHQEELLSEMKIEFQKIVDGMVGGDSTPYISKITYNDAFTQVIVEVDREAYEATIDMSPLILGFAAMMCQRYSGQELHCEVVVKDAATGETIKSVVYPDAIEQ